MTTGIQPPPAAIAREVLRQLSARRLAPTPEHYARVYAEVAGLKPAELVPAIAALETLAHELRGAARTGPRIPQVGRDLARALERSEWERVRTALQAMITHLQPPAPTGAAAARPNDDDAPAALRELAARSLTHLVDARLGYSAEAVSGAQTLAAAIRAADSVERVHDAAAKLKQLWLKCELRGEGPEPALRALQGLVILALRNAADLVREDERLRGRLEEAIGHAGRPPTPVALATTERLLKECAYRQSAVRSDIEDHQAAIRDMMAAFVDRLGATAAAAGDFSTRLAGYAESIRAAGTLQDLSGVLGAMISDTAIVQADMTRSQGEIDAARRQVRMYEDRIAALQAKLAATEHLVREDPLTRLANRRGIEEQYMVETARARRSGRPLQLAVVQIDDFRLVGDLLGAAAANAALEHFARVLGGALRPTDTLARGEAKRSSRSCPKRRPPRRGPGSIRRAGPSPRDRSCGTTPRSPSPSAWASPAARRATTSTTSCAGPMPPARRTRRLSARSRRCAAARDSRRARRSGRVARP